MLHSAYAQDAGITGIMLMMFKGWRREMEETAEEGEGSAPGISCNGSAG